MSIVPFVEWSPLPRFEFTGVIEGVFDQIGDVPIRNRVVNVVAVPTPTDQAFAAQEPQALRHGREFIVPGRDDLRDAEFALL